MNPRLKIKCGREDCDNWGELTVESWGYWSSTPEFHWEHSEERQDDDMDEDASISFDQSFIVPKGWSVTSEYHSLPICELHNDL